MGDNPVTAQNRHLAKAERDAPSVEIVQALLESENEVDALRAEVRRLLTLGQGQRTLDLLARYEALLEEHADCLAVAHQQESELEQTATALRNTETVIESARNLLRHGPIDGPYRWLAKLETAVRTYDGDPPTRDMGSGGVW